MTEAHETKSVEIVTAFDDFRRTFEAFKETNDERLARVETRLSADVVTEEKLARIDRALDEAKSRLDTRLLEQARPCLALADRASEQDFATREHKAAFRAYMRSGDASALGAVPALRDEYRCYVSAIVAHLDRGIAGGGGLDALASRGPSTS